VLVAALTTAVFAVGTVLAVRNYRDDRRDAERLARLTAQEAAVRVDMAVADRIAFLSGVARLQAVVESDRAGIHGALSRLVRGGLADQLGWVRPDGRVAVLTGVPLGRVPDAQPAERPIIREVVRTGRPDVSGALSTPGDPRGAYVVVTVPTTGADGRTSGVLTGTLRLDDLAGPLRIAEDQRDLRLLDAAGGVIAGRGRIGVAPVASDPGTVALVRSGTGVVTGRPGLLGEPDQMVAYAPVPSAGWVAVYQQPRLEALSSARREFGTRVLVWLGLAVTGIALAWFVGRRLDRSVAGERLARGRVDLLRRTGAALAAAVTVDEVTAAAISDPELGAIAVAIYRWPDRPPVAVAGGLSPDQERRLRDQVPRPEGPVAHTLRTETAHFLGQAPEDAAVSLAGLTNGPRPAAATLPLRVWSQPTGVMLLAFPGPRRFSADQQALLRTLADQTAQALDRAIQHEAERARRRRAELLERLSTALEREMTVRGRAQLATELLIPDVADFASIERFDPQGPVVLGLHHRDPALEPVLRSLRTEHRLSPDEEHSVAHAGIEGGTMLIERVTPELIAQVTDDPGTRDLLRRLAPTSHLAVPLRARGHLAGVLVLGRGGTGGGHFDAGDLRFGEEIAMRLGVALENAQLYEEQREIALGLQLSLLPESVPDLPGNILAVRYRPGQHHMEVGGDWYDALALPDGRFALAVGDVVGRGLSAAAAMGRLRTALAALAPRTSGPADLLRELDAFSESVPGSQLTTLTYAVFSPRTGHLTYASAGHPPGLVIYPDGVTHWLLGGRSVPLRSVPHPARAQAGAELPPGAKLLLYSDGLVERRGEGIDDGLDRLAAAARRHHLLAPEDLIEALVNDLDDPGELGDDLVVLCLEHVGPAGPPRTASPRPEGALTGA